MKQNLRFETEFPISTFILTPQIVELKEKVLQTVKIMKLVKTEAEFAEV